MCRLVTYSGGPLPLSPLVYGGNHSLLRQSWAPRELLSGSVNADGWGVAWYHDGVPRRLAEARPLWHEGGLETLLQSVRSTVALAALRNTTPGIPADRSGLPPLVVDRWTFILNGYVPDFRRRHMRALRSHLPDSLYARLQGASDTETLFLLALSEVGGGAGLLEALERVAERVGARVEGEAQLTLVLSDGEETAVLRTSTVEATNSLYLARGHAMAPGGVLVASERLDDDPAWEALPAHAGILLRDGEARVEERDGPVGR